MSLKYEPASEQDVTLSRDHTEFRLEDEEVRAIPDAVD